MGTPDSPVGSVPPKMKPHVVGTLPDRKFLFAVEAKAKLPEPPNSAAFEQMPQAD